jgi:hypothetical protein
VRSNTNGFVIPSVARNLSHEINNKRCLYKRTPVTPQEQERLSREIQSTDREIDRLVYELYGLTEEEIKIVDGE